MERRATVTPTVQHPNWSVDAHIRNSTDTAQPPADPRKPTATGRAPRCRATGPRQSREHTSQGTCANDHSSLPSHNCPFTSWHTRIAALCDRSPATTCPSPMPGSRTTHPSGMNTSMVPGARMNAPRIFMMRGAHCVHVVEKGFAPRRPNAGTARGEAPWCVRDQLIPRRRRQPSRRSW